MLAARSRIDHEDTRCPGRAFVLGPRPVDRGLSLNPVEAEIVVEVGITRAGFARLRGLARIDIGVPGGLDDLAELALQRLEGWVDVLGEEAFLELRLIQLDR